MDPSSPGTICLHLTTVKPCLEHSTRHDSRIPSFLSLQYLSISMRSLESTDGSFTVSPDQPDLLSTILSGETQPALEALNLTFSWGIPRNLHHDTEEAELSRQTFVVRGTHWDTLESVLLDRSLFPQLRAVRIQMHIVEYRSSALIHRDYRSTDNTALGRTLREQLLTVLPRLKNSDLVLDVGEEGTRRSYNCIAKRKLGAAWTYESPR